LRWPRVTISTRKEFEEWLKTQPREVCVAIAYRAAMRVLPLAALVPDDRTIWTNLALAAFRASLTSGVAAVGPTPEVKSAARPAAGAAARAAADAAYAAAGAARPAADAAAGAAADAARAAARAAADAAYAAAGAARPAAGAAARAAADAAADAAYAAAGAAARAAADAAIFADFELAPETLPVSVIPVPAELTAAIAKMAEGRTDFLASGGPWTFWTEWHARAMAGDPLPWDLQEKIALIPDDIWEAGPEAVAAEIEKIEAAFRLRERIAEMEADQARPEDARFGIGGNNPPVEIDDPEVGRQMIILWDSVSGLKEEVEADEPDAERVSKLNAAVRAALGALFSWCGRKLDLAIDTFVTEGIKFAFSLKGLGAIYLVVDPARVQAVLKAAEDWLQLLLR
jgi:multidrug efflux pump subunit AcrA (membrane-fusion protein)